MSKRKIYYYFDNPDSLLLDSVRNLVSKTEYVHNTNPNLPDAYNNVSQPIAAHINYLVYEVTYCGK